ncbi:MAG TPA: hypothetical protein DDX14_04500, partial [Cyanobacteria bacterium UBA9579]|nr:hypothetical protein [Cyanobacteria bacterium UBA9579]
MDRLNLSNQGLQKYVGFLGKRTDHNLVKELTQDSGALFKPKERQLLEAINRLSTDNSNETIEFLLSVAQDLKYGVRKNSALGSFLDQDSNIKDRKNKQNVNWEETLKASIRKALDVNTSNDKAALEEKFAKVFPEPVKTDDEVSKLYWLSANPAVQQEQEAISLRNKILASQEFNKQPQNLSTQESEQLKAHKKDSRKNIDFFLASSESSISEKVEILKLLSHLMSPEYKINPQLQDRKVQVLSEVLNDIIIKTPGRNKLTTKDVSQRNHGMCVAISISRKALPNEHKLAHVTNILSELSDKPTMEVHDVTDHKKKVTVEKPEIDFAEAFRQGYRIVDTSALNWMHIADSTGNGEIQGKKFVSFDKENYGMMQDAHLVLDMAPEFKPEQDMLRAAMKTKEIIDMRAKVVVEGIEEKEAKIASNAGNPKTFDDTSARMANQVHKNVENILKELLPESDENKAKILAEKLLDPRKVEDSRHRIDSREEEFTKKQKLKALIKAEAQNVNSEKLNVSVDKIFDNYTTFESIVKERKEKSEKHSLAAKVEHYESLFKLAAFYRVQKERELDVPDRLAKLAENLKVPAQKEAVLQKLESRGDVLPRETLDNLQAKFEEIKSYSEQKKLARREGKELNIPEPYNFSESQKEVFKKIESDYSRIRRETIRNYKDLNNKLAPQLDELYTRAGRAFGHPYAEEEGHSGLSTGQGTRILVQASGAPHYVENNAKIFADHIESAKGGSISMSHVENYEFSGHSQYVYDVDKVNIRNPKTGELKEERVFRHDNTWGPSEKDGWDKVWGNKKDKFSNWKDSAGNFRTDYSKKRGGEYGYLFSPNYTNGVTESEFLSGIGIHKPDQVDNAAMKKLDKSIGVKYSLFMDAILRGKFSGAAEKAFELISTILNKQNSEATVSKYFDSLKDNQGKGGARFDIHLDRLAEIEKEANIYKDKVIGLIQGSKGLYNRQLGLPKGIESKEDFDKIPENHPVKLLLKKVVMSETLGHFDEQYTQNTIVNIQKQGFKALVREGKFGKEKLEINSISDLEKNPLGKAVISWIDNKFDPQNDKAFMEVYKNLANMDSQSFDKLLESSTPEELGIKFDDPYILVQRIRARNDESIKSVWKQIFQQTHNKVFDEIKQEETEKGGADSAKKLIHLYNGYRELSVGLSHLESEKNRQLIFDQYGVRAATPRIEVVPDELLKENAKANLGMIGGLAANIAALKQVKEQKANDPTELELIDQKINSLKQDIDVNSAVLIKANVIPRNQNKVAELLKHWVKRVAVDSKSPESQKQFDNLADELTKNHVTKHPKEFLNYMTKELIQMDLNDDKDLVNSSIINFWFNHMKQTLRAAESARLEYKLMSNVEEGKMP